MSGVAYIIEVEWDKPGLPRLVGPFATREEAAEWGSLNVRNGVWNVAPLAYPYMQGGN